jgi:ABC-2 type transport system permease protein
VSRILALIDRELRSVVRSPVAFAVVGVYLGLHGIFFAQLVEEFSTVSAQALMRGSTRDELNLVDMVVRPIVSADSVLLLILLPALSMRQLAEEWRQGTSDLLLSYPVRDREIVLGKYLAGLVVLCVMVALGILYPAAMGALGRIEPGVLVTSLVGLFLYGAMVLAIGLFFSSLTENQVIAMVSTLMALLALTVLGYWGLRVDPPWSHLLRYLSMQDHVKDFGAGVVRLSDVVFFGSMSGLFLFLTSGVFESRRWGGVTR